MPQIHICIYYIARKLHNNTLNVTLVSILAKIKTIISGISVVILLEMLLAKYQTITFIEQQCLICHDSPMTLSVLDCGCRLKYIAICPNFQANNYRKICILRF